MERVTEKMGMRDLTVFAYEMGTLRMLNCVETLAITLMRASGRIQMK